MKLNRTPKFAPVALLAASAAVALLAGACKTMETTETPAKPQSPATGPTMQGPAPVMPTTKPVAMAEPMMKESDCTHTLTMDCPAYESMPMGDAKPAMMAKSGTMCLVTTPGSKYSKVMMTSGKTMYVPTAALKAIGK